ncbi:hypothetical protein GLOIN_2v1786344 [Rhizophagus irregularis DAOM 181602=DAOM 197198]|nr:hypothetical protein GLOIN_2v1786344 [Rhizophagus irregularis DAOM 181602=DAOM 197198]
MKFISYPYQFNIAQIFKVSVKYTCEYLHNTGKPCGHPCVRPEGCRIYWKTKSRFPCAVCGKPTGSSKHEWLKSSNESILEYHKNSMPQWIAESCHRYYRHFVSFIPLALIKAI